MNSPTDPRSGACSFGQHGLNCGQNITFEAVVQVAIENPHSKPAAIEKVLLVAVSILPSALRSPHRSRNCAACAYLPPVMAIYDNKAKLELNCHRQPDFSTD